jgi:hypothetical protein
MNGKKKKISKNLDCFSGSSLDEQKACFESTIEKLEDEDFMIIDAACQKIVTRLRYANIKQRIEYADGLELLAKLGVFLSLNSMDGDQNG